MTVAINPFFVPSLASYLPTYKANHSQNTPTAKVDIYKARSQKNNDLCRSQVKITICDVCFRFLSHESEAPTPLWFCATHSSTDHRPKAMTSVSSQTHGIAHLNALPLKKSDHLQVSCQAVDPNYLQTDWATDLMHCNQQEPTAHIDNSMLNFALYKCFGAIVMD